MSKVIKNTTYLTLGFILQKFLTFIYFSIVARLVGVEGTGVYSFALGYTTMFSMLVDLGLNKIIIRECAKDKSKTNELLNNTLGIKLILGVLVFVIVTGSITFLEQDPLNRLMVYLAAVLMVVDSFIVTVWAVFRGWQQLQYEAMAVVIAQIIIVTVGLTGLFLNWPIWVLLVALISGSIFNFLFGFTILHKKLKLKVFPRFNVGQMKALLLLSLPFAFLELFTRLYMSSDIVLLKFLGGEQGEEHVGFYAVPYKIIFALQFLPAAFGGAIYPAMSDYYVRSKERLQSIFEKAMQLLLVLAVPAAFGIMVLAYEIIVRIYGVEYSPSVSSLQILSFILIFVFLGYPIGSLLNACERQNQNTRNVGITLCVSLALNFLLIPKYQYVGASIAALVSNIVLVLLGLWEANFIVKYRKIFLFNLALKTTFSGLIMAFVVSALKMTFGEGDGLITILFNLLGLPLIGGIIYFIVLYLVKGFSFDDISGIKKSFKKT